MTELCLINCLVSTNSERELKLDKPVSLMVVNLRVESDQGPRVGLQRRF